jgi:hypothetical protein
MKAALSCIVSAMYYCLLYGDMCVFLFEQLLTGARELRLIKLQEGWADITFTS